jgi:hypothetical protein
LSAPEHDARYPTRCLHAAIDAESYSGRTSLPQRDLQSRIQAALYGAAEAIGFAPSQLWFQPQGDGGTIRFPPAIDEAAVVAGLTRELRVELEAVNRELVRAARVRLRLAFVVGVSSPAALGLAGDPPVAVNRLLNAQELRARLAAAPEAALAVIIPDALYTELVMHRLRGLDPAEWQPVRVVDTSKKFDSAAWITVPGAAPAMDSAVPPASATPAGGTTAAAAADAVLSTATPPAGTATTPDAMSIGSIGNVSVFHERIDIKEGGFHIG